MPILILSLSLLFVRVSGSLTGVELRVAPGPQLEAIGINTRVMKHGDTVDVKLEHLINPLGVLGKPSVTLIFPYNSSIHLELSATISNLVLDLTKSASTGLDLALKFSSCDIVLGSAEHTRAEIYSLGSKIRMVNAELLSRGAIFNLKGGSVSLQARSRIPGTLYFFADGTRISLSIPASVKLKESGFFNRKSIPHGENRTAASIVLSGNFNTLKVSN